MVVDWVVEEHIHWAVGQRAGGQEKGRPSVRRGVTEEDPVMSLSEIDGAKIRLPAIRYCRFR